MIYLKEAQTAPGWPSLISATCPCTVQRAQMILFSLGTNLGGLGLLGNGGEVGLKVFSEGYLEPDCRLRHGWCCSLIVRVHMVPEDNATRDAHHCS